MTTDLSQTRVVFGLADGPEELLQGDSWIGGFLALGLRLRRYLLNLGGRQLVIAVTVPRRDYVAALIGAGWMLSSPAPQLREPIEVFRAARPGAHLRAVTDKSIDAGMFSKLDESRPDPRVATGGKTRLVSFYKAVAVLDDACESVQSEVPEAGFLGDWTGASREWLQRLAAPPADLALVGTKKWLLDDLGAYIGVAGAVGTPLENYVLPIGGKAATWATSIISAPHLAEGGAFPRSCTLVVLDRYGAIKYLNDIMVPMVVCIVDRSVADDSSAELIVQARLSNSRPVSLQDDLGWHPPSGAEAMAFTVAL